MIQKLKPTALTEESKKLKKRFEQFNLLIDEINKKEISEVSQQQMNEMIGQLEGHKTTAKLFSINIRRTQSNMLKLLLKEYKIVPKNHFRNTWMAIGMSAFGIPLGVALGGGLNNMAFIGIGLPIGMVMGLAVGAEMDKKAEKENRQLNIQIEL